LGASCSVRLEAGFARTLALYMDDAYFETAGEALAGLAARNDAMTRVFKSSRTWSVRLAARRMGVGRPGLSEAGPGSASILPSGR
jgi:hypothetical protein